MQRTWKDRRGQEFGIGAVVDLDGEGEMFEVVDGDAETVDLSGLDNWDLLLRGVSLMRVEVA